MVRQRRSANRLETEGPQSDEATGKARAESNVIRLPRDWLGPRDELVPFGTRAAGPDHAAAGDSRPSEPPPRAADFWGEESATVQDAVPAPAPPPVAEPPVPRTPRWRARARALAPRRGARARAMPPRVASTRAFATATAAVAVAAAAVLLGVGVVQVGPTGSSRPEAGGGPASRASGLAVVFPPALLGVENWPLSQIRTARHPTHFALRRAHASPSRRVRSLPSPRPVPVSTSSATTPTQPTTTRYSAPRPSPATGSGTQVARSPQVTAPAYNAPITSAPATGASAFGPSGVLGPGSSRNG